jgi:hypothetical protein
VFEDAGVSGAWEKRPAFESLIASCKASPRKEPALVLVLNDSRWGRFEDSEDSTYFRRELGRIGWRVQFAEHDDVQDDFARPIMRALAQSQASLYRRTLKANVLRGCRGQAEQGYWQAKAPFGYQRRVVYPPGRERTLENHIPKATDEKLVLVPHPEEAPIVQTCSRATSPAANRSRHCSIGRAPRIHRAHGRARRCFAAHEPGVRRRRRVGSHLSRTGSRTSRAQRTGTGSATRTRRSSRVTSSRRRAGSVISEPSSHARRAI